VYLLQRRRPKPQFSLLHCCIKGISINICFEEIARLFYNAAAEPAPCGQANPTQIPSESLNTVYLALFNVCASRTYTLTMFPSTLLVSPPPVVKQILVHRFHQNGLSIQYCCIPCIIHVQLVRIPYSG